MKMKHLKHVFSAALVAMLTASSLAAPAVADSTSVDVSNSHAVARHSKHKSSNDSAPVNENRDASNSPVVQPGGVDEGPDLHRCRWR